jgi:xanthine dehydrogenase YagR molybdenum-binding subunit
MELAWPDPNDTKLLGKRIQRLDGPDKVTGRAKYTFDTNRPRMLWAKYTTCPFGRAKVKSIDVAAAKAMPGVVTVDVLANVGAELKVAFSEVAIVAAESEEIAREAVRRIKVEYEVLEHNVVDDDPQIAGGSAKPGKANVKGDPDKAFEEAAAKSDTEVGCSILTHCCMESHGSVVEVAEDGKSLTAWCSTQAISGKNGDFAGYAGVGDAAAAEVICQHMGGGFGSKFGADAWGDWAAKLSARTKRPVKLMLERDMELALAGSRPSAFARMRVACKEDGTVTAFEAEAWGSGGTGGGLGVNRLPYVFGNIPNLRTRNTPIATNTGDQRAWRAPNHPQMALLTMAALSDCAAELGMDELDFFKKNLGYTDRAKVYEEELHLAAELIDWKKKWIGRGDQKGVVRHGLGLSMHTWGGGGHDSNVQCTVHPDGAVEITCGTQDLGVGTRTVLAIVAAETFGLPLEKVKVAIGDTHYPSSGGSGGSTTVGGVSSATRDACVKAANELFEKVAPDLGGDAKKLVAKEGKLFAADNPAKAVPWDVACRSLGTAPLVTMGRTQAKLMNSQVGGAQMAEVEVDTETGIVRVLKMVAVQDCGRIIDLLTAESQVRGAQIMGVCGALYEERIMDPVTGTLLNPDMEFYKLAGIADVGELVVKLMETPEHLNRGVIGLGEPPVISPMAALSNAVANAIGARVKRCPMTPDRVLAAMKNGGA